ncbi:MAG: hypothetical protein KDB07_12195 [Planctomycetes bacterium]|nr:hypothetical protein [Planctomycetota bacterium]
MSNSTSAQSQTKDKASGESAELALPETPNFCGDWVEKLNGYEFRLLSFLHACSRLSLRADDCIARRPSGQLVFHDVTYIEMPLTTGKVKLREATPDEYEKVRAALGGRVRPSNVIAFQATGKRVFLIEFGFAQWLHDYQSA